MSAVEKEEIETASHGVMEISLGKVGGGIRWRQE
jgi:hypothetical protein